MMADNSKTIIADPFADPLTIFPEREAVSEAVLAVGDRASLTLSADALIVLDEKFETTRCCGLLPQRLTPTRTIPYFNVLSATVSKSDIVIRYAKPSSKKPESDVYVQTLSYQLASSHDLAQRWASHLLSLAYGSSQRNKRIKVLINPFGGVGRAAKLYTQYIAPIFAAAECIVEIEQTKYMGHATEIVEQMNIDDYDVVACASGDGLPHEAFNGLARKTNATEALRKIAIVQLPCGTGNAMSLNLNGTNSPSLAALTIVKGIRTPMDLVSITQGNNRSLSFLSQAIGIVAETDLGTDNIRWMGDFRFTYGFLIRLLGQTLYPIDISVKTEVEDKAGIKAHYAREISKLNNMDQSMTTKDILDQDPESSSATLGLPPLRYGTVNDPLPEDWEPLSPYTNLGNFYCGNMTWMAADTPFFPASLPNDGLLDLVTVDGDIARLKAVGMLLAVENNKFLDNPLVRYRKVSGIRVVPHFGWDGARKDTEMASQSKSGLLGKALSKITGGKAGKEGFFAVDGEKFPFEPFQIEVHRGLGTVLSKRWGRYEFDEGPRGWHAFADSTSTDDDSPVQFHERAL